MEEKKNQAWRATNTKKCPKCGVDTEKNHGCNHMTCYICKTGWCWLCGEVIGNKVLPDHYKEGKCKGKQFTGEESVAYMAQWEATLCIMLPALFLLLFSPIAFVMAIVVCIISPCFYMFLCCFDEERDREVHVCIGNCMNIIIFGPILLVTLPFWLPCFIYYTCVIAPRRVRLQAALNDVNAVAQALEDLEQGQQQPPQLDHAGEGDAAERDSATPMMPGGPAAAGADARDVDASVAGGDASVAGCEAESAMVPPGPQQSVPVSG
uniref:RING-type domain-containing protein n=2 Tax=Lotharella globosa TaxID=91324 RepID=A0A7S4DIY1_9EUKA